VLVPTFLCDAMLGSLARWLRFFGYDTEFCGPEVDDPEVARRARADGRWLLTRDRELAALGPRTVMVRSEGLEAQLAEVFRRLDLHPSADLDGSRCGECNGELEPVTRSEAQEAVPPYVHRTARRFRRCTRCGRMYWPGTHTDRILATMSSVICLLEESTPEG
jgi:uncharacterized protein with PIN domain